MDAGARLRGLQQALDALDDTGAQAAFDDLLARYGVDSILRDVILPYLHDLGERWATGAASVAQEHFASALLRGRLLGLARGWDQGGGPRAVLACAPGELHDLSLIVFGLALRRHGWRITYLGADTPLATIDDIAGTLDSDVVVLVAIATGLEDEREALAVLAAQRPLALAGTGVTDDLARASARGGSPAIRSPKRPGSRRSASAPAPSGRARRGDLRICGLAATGVASRCAPPGRARHAVPRFQIARRVRAAAANEGDG